MITASLNPHLTFNGDCEAAFNFYKSVFGGEFASFLRYGVTASFQDIPGAEKERVMHVSLRLTEHVCLGGCDAPLSDPPAQSGDNISLLLSFADDAETRRVHDALSAGGAIRIPLEKTFFASLYGTFTDAFGINWGLISTAPFNCPITGEPMKGAGQ